MKLTEHKSAAYPPRTRHNAETADLTVAFAEDFQSGGEKLTHRLAGEKYVGIPLKTDATQAARNLFVACRQHKVNVLNIAGNGIYTLRDYDWTQENLNLWVFQVLSLVHKHWPLKRIISGGQTGVDWAGGVAAEVLGISSEMTFPKDYLQRTLTDFKLTQSQADVQRKLDDDVRVLRGMLVERGIEVPAIKKPKPEAPTDFFELT